MKIQGPSFVGMTGVKGGKGNTRFLAALEIQVPGSFFTGISGEKHMVILMIKVSFEGRNYLSYVCIGYGVFCLHTY